MSSKRVYSTWTKDVEMGDIYDEFKEDTKLLEFAYEAVNNFCRKEQKKNKYNLKRKACWQ